MAPPFREVEFDILYGEGISREGDVVDLGAEGGIIDKAGAWFSFEGERIGQGRENVKTYLREHPEMAAKIEGLILSKHGIKRDFGEVAMSGVVHEIAKPGKK
jgi:recombination protein RecA